MTCRKYPTVLSIFW